MQEHTQIKYEIMSYSATIASGRYAQDMSNIYEAFIGLKLKHPQPDYERRLEAYIAFVPDYYKNIPENYIYSKFDNLIFFVFFRKHQYRDILDLLRYEERLYFKYSGTTTPSYISTSDSFIGENEIKKSLENEKIK